MFPTSRVKFRSFTIFDFKIGDIFEATFVYLNYNNKEKSANTGSRELMKQDIKDHFEVQQYMAYWLRPQLATPPSHMGAGIPYRTWFISSLLHFQFSSPLMVWGKAVKDSPSVWVSAIPKRSG